MQLNKSLLFLFLAVLSNFYFAYGQITVKVLDKDLKTPIPYASVYNKQKHIGLYSDENGTFILPDNLSPNDTLIISNIGYKIEKVIINKLKSEIYLKSIVNILNEVIITPKGQEITLGALKKESHFAYSFNQFDLHNEIALLIQNERKRTGTLISVSFYISPSSKPQTPFRLRLYSTKDKKPNQDFISKSVIVHASRKGGWLEINLKDDNIPFSDNGIFVSMEYLYGLKKSSFYKNKNMSTGKTEIKYGQSLGLTDEFETAIAYQRRFNDEWVPFSAKFPSYISTATFYPMMKIKIKLDE